MNIKIINAIYLIALKILKVYEFDLKGRTKNLQFYVTKKKKSIVNYSEPYCKDTVQKIGFKYSQNETARPRSQFLNVSVSDLYIPRNSQPIWLQHNR